MNGGEKRHAHMRVRYAVPLPQPWGEPAVLTAVHGAEAS